MSNNDEKRKIKPWQQISLQTICTIDLESSYEDIVERHLLLHRREERRITTNTSPYSTYHFFVYIEPTETKNTSPTILSFFEDFSSYCAMITGTSHPSIRRKHIVSMRIILVAASKTQPNRRGFGSFSSKLVPQHWLYGCATSWLYHNGYLARTCS